MRWPRRDGDGDGDSEATPFGVILAAIVLVTFKHYSFPGKRSKQQNPTQKKNVKSKYKVAFIVGHKLFPAKSVQFSFLLA